MYNKLFLIILRILILKQYYFLNVAMLNVINSINEFIVIIQIPLLTIYFT